MTWRHRVAFFRRDRHARSTDWLGTGIGAAGAGGAEIKFFGRHRTGAIRDGVVRAVAPLGVGSIGGMEFRCAVLDDEARAPASNSAAAR
jgi:hypothetical protein